MSSPLLTLVQHDAVTALAIVVTAAILFAAWLGFLKIVRPKYADRTGNGIAAGPIKVYDNRFLSIRLDELESNIGKLGAIDPDKLDENVGTTQAKVESTGEVGLSAGVNARGGTVRKIARRQNHLPRTLPIRNAWCGFAGRRFA